VLTSEGVSPSVLTSGGPKGRSVLHDVPQSGLSQEGGLLWSLSV
jgi:hypothetical protein